MNLNVIKAPETNLQEGEAGRGWRKLSCRTCPCKSLKSALDYVFDMWVRSFLLSCHPCLDGVNTDGLTLNTCPTG